MSNPYDVLSQLTPEQAEAWKAQFGSPPQQVNDLVDYANQTSGTPSEGTSPAPSAASVADLQGAADYYGQLANTPAAVQPRPDNMTYAPAADSDFRPEQGSFAPKDLPKTKDEFFDKIGDAKGADRDQLELYGKEKGWLSINAGKYGGDVVAAGSPMGDTGRSDHMYYDPSNYAAGSSGDAAQGAAFTQNREQTAAQRAHDAENLKRILSGRPTLEEEARKAAKQKAKALMPGVSGGPRITASNDQPGAGRYEASFAVPAALMGSTDMALENEAVSKQISQMNQAQANPKGPSIIRDKYGIVQGVDWGSPSAPQATPNQINAAAKGDLTQPPQPAPEATPNARPALTTDVVNTPEGRERLRQMYAEPGEPEEAPPAPIQYSPVRVIPGERTPAAWQIKEGQQIPEEDLGRIAEARAAQQAGIANTADAAAQGAQAQAADLAAQGKAYQDLNTMQQARQQRMLDAKQQQVNKLSDMVDQIRNRKMDDSAFLLPGTAGKLFSAIGVAIGAGVQARLGLRQNPSLEIVNSRINEIVQKNREQMERDKNSLSSQQSLLGQMQDQFGDQRTADQAAKVALLERAKIHADEVAATSQVPRIRANAQALSADLDMQSAKEKTQFDLAAQDQVMRKDVMTKPVVTGGQPIGGAALGVSDAERERSVQLPVEMGGYPGGTRLIANDAKSAEKLRTVAAGYSVISGLRDKAQAILSQYGNDVYISGTKGNNAYRALITNAVSQAGHVNAQAKQPVVDTHLLEEQLTPSAWNTLGGPSIVDRFDNALDAYSTSASAILKAEAPEVSHRYIARTPSGRVIPQAEYTGDAPAPHALPKSAQRTGLTIYGPPSTSRILDQKKDVRAIPEPQPASKGRKKDVVPYAPANVESDDEDE